MKHLFFIFLFFLNPAFRAQDILADSLRKLPAAEAELYLERLEKTALGTKNYEALERIYDQYSTYYEKKKDYRNAYKYHVLFSQVQDSLRDRASSLSRAESKARYETDIRREQSEQLSTESRANDLAVFRKKTQRNTVIMVCIAAIALALLVYGGRQLKKREKFSRLQLQQEEGRSRSVIEAEERERSRIARELNEGIGQQLSAAKLNISALQSVLKTTSEADRLMLRNVVELLDDSVKEVRNVSHSMIPNVLVKSGLVPAARELVNKINEVQVVKVDLEVIGLIERMKPPKEAVLFRVLQEVINNSLHHAQASRLFIQLVKHERELSILVEDNGIGFDVAQTVAQDTSTGLKSIQSRVAFLSGTVFFDSRPTKGTTVTIEIPM